MPAGASELLAILDKNRRQLGWLVGWLRSLPSFVEQVAIVIATVVRFSALLARSKNGQDSWSWPTPPDDDDSTASYPVVFSLPVTPNAHHGARDACPERYSFCNQCLFCPNKSVFVGISQGSPKVRSSLTPCTYTHCCLLPTQRRMGARRGWEGGMVESVWTLFSE